MGNYIECLDILLGNTRFYRRKHRTAAQRDHKAISEPRIHMKRTSLYGIRFTINAYNFEPPHTEYTEVRLRREMSPEPIAESMDLSRLLEPLFAVDRPARSMNDTAEDNISPSRTFTQVARTLVEHSCPDVTSKLLFEQCDQEPFRVGGESKVYRGVMRTETSNRSVAIKYRSQSKENGPSALRDVSKELYVWSRCCHFNVLPLLGLARYRGRIAIVMPLVQLGCLADYIMKYPDLDRLSACSQIGDGLAYIHSRGIAHGDIKTSNLLVLNDGTIQLADFGSSVIRNHSLHFSSRADSLHLTPNWAAPEVLRKEVSRTTMSDVYSYGMTMLEILTGEVPFVGLKFVTIFLRVAGQKKTPDRLLCCIPRGRPGDKFWRLLERCWSADPMDRPSAFEARNTLRSIKFDFTALSPGTHADRPFFPPICGYKPERAS